jgi:hypothetical protein
VVSQFSYLFAFDDVVLSFDINFIGTGQFLVELLMLTFLVGSLPRKNK